MRGLSETVWDLLQDAADLYRDERLHHHLQRFEEPLRVAVAGPAKSGKSTLVNALMGEEIAPIGESFTWYQDGAQPHIMAYSANGSAQELDVSRSVNGIRIDQRGWRPDSVEDIVVTWPTRALRNVTLVDTPSATDRLVSDADALLYLTPDARGTDLRALQATQEGVIARSAPVNVIMVLSRADEIGGGRIDALVTAKQLARHLHRGPQVNSVCMGVVAFGGLVALASRVLTEVDFAALAAMASTPRMDLEIVLLSTDRFVGTDFPVSLDVDVRRALLDRFGIHGVRLATTLIRTGCDTRAKLAAELVKRSGLTELRESMNQYFIERREVLKARSALVALESVVQGDSRRGAAELLGRMEQILATTHDFRELRLLASLRTAGAGFDSDLLGEAHRLIGGNGTHLAPRLGVDHDTDVNELWALGNDALHRWQNHAEDRQLSLPQRRVAGVVVRSRPLDLIVHIGRYDSESGHGRFE